MTSCQRFKQEAPWDPFLGALEEYPDIQNYVSNFQVKLKSDLVKWKIAKIPRHFKDSIVVFKKKKLLANALHLNSNIYKHDPSNLELDELNENKSKSSCLRCRKFKKKCTRDLPECLNCVSCDELCIYIPRKRKSSTASVTDLEKRNSISAASSISSYSRPGSQSLDPLDTPLTPGEPTDEVKRRFSMPTRLPTSKENVYGKLDDKHQLSTNGGSNHSSSNLYMLLN